MEIFAQNGELAKFPFKTLFQTSAQGQPDFEGTLTVRFLTHRVPTPARERFPGLPVYCYRQRFGSPPAGLAAVKQARAEEARERAHEDARLNAAALVQPRRRPIENEVSKLTRLNREELRLVAGGSAKQRQMTTYELYLWHVENGSAHIFLASLKHG